MLHGYFKKFSIKSTKKSADLNDVDRVIFSYDDLPRKVGHLRTTPVMNRVADLICKTTRGPCNSSTNRASCSPAALRWKRANVQTEMQSGTRLSARAECERGRTYRSYIRFRTYPMLAYRRSRCQRFSSEPIPWFTYSRKQTTFFYSAQCSWSVVS